MPNLLRQTDVVPEFCTCGAELPEDARFCHRCGKPQREEIVVEQPLPPPPPIPAIPTQVWTGVPSFHHPVAVLVCLFVVSIASFLVLSLPLGFMIWQTCVRFTS